MKSRFLPFLLLFAGFVSAVAQNGGPINIAAQTQPITCGLCTGGIYVTIQGGMPPYFFSVFGPGGYTSSGTPNLNGFGVLGLCIGGSYVVNVGDVTGSVTTDTVVLTEIPFTPLEIYSANPAPCNHTDSIVSAAQCERVCPNTSVTYYVQSSLNPPGTSSFISWIVSGASSFTYNNPPFNTSITVQWGSAGTGSVSVAVDGGSQNNCPGEDALCVTIIEEPVAQFSTIPSGAPLQICAGQTVQFDNESTGADSYEWFFSDDLSTTVEVNPEHTFFTPGVYTVRLIARSDCLCADTTETQITVLDAVSPTLDCVGTICPGATVTYTAGNGCEPFNWTVSPNGSVLAGGTPFSDTITIQWNAGPEGLISLNAQACSGNTCPEPTLISVPIISDNAEIRGPERVCPGSSEVYSIEPYGGTGFVWAISGGGTISEGQGANRIVVQWSDFPNPAITRWISVEYDNCYLGCGGRDSIGVLILSPFVINGPVEICENTSGAFTARTSFNNQALACNWQMLDPAGGVVWTAAAQSSVMPVFNSGVGYYRLFATPVNPNLSCTDEAEWVVEARPQPAKPGAINGPTTICPGTSYTYEVPGVPLDNNVRWTVQNGPGAAQTLNGNPVNVNWAPGGPHSISAALVSADGLNCISDTLTLAINQLSAPVINGPILVCEDETAVYNMVNLPGNNFQWQISPLSAAAVAAGQGTNTVDIFWTEPGGHTINLSVCGQTAIYPVTVLAKPMPMTTHPAALCPGAVASVQTLTAFNTYEWRNEAGLVLANGAPVNLSAGSYAVLVSDANGCVGTSEFTINESPIPNVSLSTADPTGFCNNSFTVGLSALTTADADNIYQWFRDGNPVGGNTPGYSTNQYGSYTVVVTNPFGCTNSAGPVVLFNYCGGGGGGFGFPGAGASCPPGAVDIGITGTGICDTFQFSVINGGQYTAGTAVWTFGQSGASVLSTVNAENPTIGFPNAGKYIVVLQAQLSNGATCYVIDSVNVEAKAQFDPSPECPGDPTFFKDVSSFLPWSSIIAWDWTFGDPASGAANQSVFPDPFHSYTAGGNVAVRLRITTNSGCTSTVQEIVPIPAPTAFTFPAPLANCAGNALEFIASGSPEITEFNWDFGDPGSGAANDAGGSPVFHNYAAPGVYLVTATSTNAYGCLSVYNRNVDVFPNPLSGSIIPAAPAPICEGNTVSLTAPAGAIAYIWSDGTMTQTNVVGTEGVYQVTLTDANGCTYVPPPVTVEITPGPDALVKALLKNDLGQVIGLAYPDLSACQGEDVILQAFGAGTYNYAWSGGNGFTNQAVFSDDRNNLLPVGTHTYWVTVTDIVSGCTSVTDPFVVTVNPTPGGFSISANSICANQSSTLVYNGPTPSNWQFVWNTGQPGTTLVSDEAGLYFIRVINEFGCTAQSNPVQLLPGPPAFSVPAGCHTRCAPDTVCIPPLPDVVAWQWYLDGSPIPGANSPDFVAMQSGVYYAEMTDINGCTAQSDPLTLDLYTGFGNISGQVWSDVNDNGLIDAADTLVSGIGVFLVDNGAITNVANSDLNGDFTFSNILSTDYSLIVDPTTLPPGWETVIPQAQVTLVGCDALGEADLLIDFDCIPSTGTVSLSACQGTSAFYNGTFIPAGSSQQFTLVNAAGCDSVLTVSVSALPNSTGTLSVNVCPGATFDYFGTMLSPGQSAVFTLSNYLNCDSLVTVSVGTHPILSGQQTITICADDTYDFFGTPLVPGDVANVTLSSVVTGCDSVVTLSVQAYPALNGTATVPVCEGDSIDFYGTILHPGDVASVMFSSVMTGCDSMVTVTASALSNSVAAQTVKICSDDTYTFQNMTLYPGEVRQFVLPNASGCDSLLTITVDTIVIPRNTIMVSVCPGESYSYAGQNLSAGEIRQFTFTGYEGCDSIVTVAVDAWPGLVFALQSDASCHNAATGAVQIGSISGGLPPYRYSIDGGQNYQDSTEFVNLPAGAYTVQILDDNNCLFEQDLLVQEIPALEVLLSDAVLPCDTSEVLMAPLVNDIGLPLDYLWSNGDTGSAVLLTMPGPVWVEVSNVCETVRAEAVTRWADFDARTQLVYVPNVFKPGAYETLNELFRPFFAEGISVDNYHFEIFDRWGNLMFRTEQTEDAWSGGFRTQDMKPGVYVWYVQADLSICGRVIPIDLKGDVTVVR